MKVHILNRLTMHVLALIGLLGFFAMYPYSWPLLFRIDLVVEACGESTRQCLEWFSFWAFWPVIIVNIAVLVMDIRMLRRSGELQARLSRSVAMELLQLGWDGLADTSMPRYRTR